MWDPSRGNDFMPQFGGGLAYTRLTQGTPGSHAWLRREASAGIRGRCGRVAAQTPQASCNPTLRGRQELGTLPPGICSHSPCECGLGSEAAVVGEPGGGVGGGELVGAEER